MNRRRLILTVGNGMMGDDGAGALVGEMVRQEPLPDWELLVGGAMPENVLHQVRALAPEIVLVVDAADMELPAGSIRSIQADRLEDPFLMTTHTLPLTFLIQALQEFVPSVELLGIQPEVVAFGFPMSESVRKAVILLYGELKSGISTWERLEPAASAIL